MGEEVPRRSGVSWRWVGAAAAAVLVAVLVVLLSWTGSCTSQADAVGTEDVCSTGPRLSVPAVFLLLADAAFLVRAVRRIRGRAR